MPQPVVHVTISDPWPFLRWFQALGPWFTAIATVAIALSARSLRKYWERRQRPVIMADHNMEIQEDNVYVPPESAAGPRSQRRAQELEREEFWIRLHIDNTSKTSANNVQLRFLSIQHERKPDKDNNRPKWWFKASNLNSTAITIHPQLQEHFDIAYVTNQIGTTDGLKLCLVLAPQELRPWSEQKQLIEENIELLLDVGCQYTMRMALYGDNLDIKYYIMKLKVDDPLAKGLNPVEILGEEKLRKLVQILSFAEEAQNPKNEDSGIGLFNYNQFTRRSNDQS